MPKKYICQVLVEVEVDSPEEIVENLTTALHVASEKIACWNREDFAKTGHSIYKEAGNGNMLILRNADVEKTVYNMHFKSS